LINRQPIETAEIETSYIVTVTCRGTEEAQIRALLVQGFGVSDLHLRELESVDNRRHRPGRRECHAHLRKAARDRTRIYRRPPEPRAERDGRTLADGEHSRLPLGCEA
jgi:hypothetical protein